VCSGVTLKRFKGKEFKKFIQFLGEEIVGNLSGLFCVSFVLMASTAAFGAAGFHRPGNPNASPEIVNASKATYSYVLISNPPYSYPAKDYDRLLKELGQNFVDELVRKEILQCQSDQKPTCEFPYGGSGTAFVVGPQRNRLITVRHNLELDVELHQKRLETELGKRMHIHIGEDEPTLSRNMSLNFQLYDRNGELAFDTRRPGDYARPEVLGFGEMVNWVKGFHGETTVDFVSIELSRSVGDVGLEFRTDRAKPGEKLAVVGFPRVSTTRSQLDSQPDSDGKSQYYSTGEVFTAADVHLFMTGPKYTSDPELEAQVEDVFLYTDSEAVKGFSGAPVIDESGKVAGILVGDWAIAHPVFYIPKNAIVLHSEWVTKNINKYRP
jgi:hypothetical protein